MNNALANLTYAYSFAVVLPWPVRSAAIEAVSDAEPSSVGPPHFFNHSRPRTGPSNSRKSFDQPGAGSAKAAPGGKEHNHVSN